jgi:hypothetical protein
LDKKVNKNFVQLLPGKIMPKSIATGQSLCFIQVVTYEKSTPGSQSCVTDQA